MTPPQSAFEALRGVKQTVRIDCAATCNFSRKSRCGDVDMEGEGAAHVPVMV